jgi:glucose/arabinose dehydrogenase
LAGNRKKKKSYSFLFMSILRNQVGTMSRNRVVFLCVFLTFGSNLLTTCGGATRPATAVAPPHLSLAPFVTGLNNPLGLEQSDDGSGRFFVVEQRGLIRIIQNSSVLATPFLDISSKVHFAGESGLLGVTFHPSYAQNGRFYVNYVRIVNSQRQSTIAEYNALPANPNRADPASERILLTVNQPAFDNHKAGQLAFGTDGFLYFGLGDGGSSGDPLSNGQNTQVLLGKLMRIDVNSTTGNLPYAIPSDNPFANGGGQPEIWAYGLRNPWRFSFDPPSGRLFLADVGEASWEEVDLIDKGGNYGWNLMEGSHCFEPPSGCNSAGLILPITEYSHGEGQAVIGGFVYHGSAIPSLQGIYVFGDFVAGKIWGLQENSGNWGRNLLASTGKNISAFGRDQNGELYAVDFSGAIWKLIAQ